MSHDNFMNAIFSVGTTFTSNEKDIFLGYLPLAHIFELIVGKDLAIATCIKSSRHQFN